MFHRIQTGGRWLLLCRYHSLKSLWFCFCSGNSVSTLISRIITHWPFSVSSLLDKLITWYKIRRSLSEDICRLILFRRKKNQNPIPACWYIGNSSWNTCETYMKALHELQLSDLKSHRAMEKANWRLVMKETKNGYEYLFLEFACIAKTGNILRKFVNSLFLFLKTSTSA